MGSPCYCSHMTRKHFEAIAAIMADFGVEPEVCSALADYFGSVNPNFNDDLFMEACES